MPEIQATFSQTEKLPFRISGFTLVREVEHEEPDRVVWDENSVRAVREITTESIIDSRLTDKEADKLVSLRIRLHTLLIGLDSTLYGLTPSQYSATYEVYNPETAEILLQKKYTISKEFEDISSYDCHSQPEAKGALYSAINDANTQFIEELYKLNAPSASTFSGKLNGTLAQVETVIPLTRKNTRWRSQGSVDGFLYAHKIQNQLKMDLPLAVTQQLQKKKVFNYDPQHKYKVVIVVPEISSSSGGWFSDKRFNLLADAVIYKDDVEVANVELDTADHEGKSLSDIIAVYSGQIVQKIQSLQ